MERGISTNLSETMQAKEYSVILKVIHMRKTCEHEFCTKQNNFSKEKVK